MHSAPPLDCAGRRRSLATMSGFHQGRPPRNKGLRYPPDPPIVEEVIAVMRAAGDRPDGLRLRGVIVVLWRAGLRVSEALALAESDLDKTRGAVLVRRGKGGKRREVGMDRWAWEQLEPWLQVRAGLPVGVAVLRAPWTHLRPSLLACRDPHAAEKRRSGGRRQATVRAAPAPPRSRSRDVPRRGPAGSHPAATGSCRPRDHLLLPAGDRQHRTHPRRPRTTSTHDPGHDRSEPRRLTAVRRPSRTRHVVRRNRAPPHRNRVVESNAPTLQITTIRTTANRSKRQR
jgi:Phage integrase family